MKSLPRSKVVMSLLLIGLAAIIIGGATSAWFTDDATVQDATFTAGTVIVETEGPQLSEGLTEKFDNINPGDCGRVTWNIINEGTKAVELRVKMDHLWDFALGELADPFAYYPLGDKWVMDEYNGELWLFYTGGPVPGTHSGASLEDRTVELTLVVAWDGPKMGNEFQGRSVILGDDPSTTDVWESYVDAIQASNDAPKTVWGEDFWNRFTAEDFVPTGKALAYYNAVSATKCWEGEIVEPDPGEYNVTVQIEGDGTVTGNDSPYEPGDEVELVASANAGSEFKGWQVVEDDSNSVSEPSGADPNFNFTMPANDVTVKAKFEKQAPPTKYKFTVKKSNDSNKCDVWIAKYKEPGGNWINTQHKPKSMDFLPGTQVGVKATDGGKWEFKKWTREGSSSSLSTNKEYTHTMPSNNETLVGNFEYDD